MDGRITLLRFMTARKSARACWRALQNTQGLHPKIFSDLGTGGTHYIVFTAADQSGNVSHATRTVIVGDGSTTLTTGGTDEVPVVIDATASSTTTVIDTTVTDTTASSTTVIDTTATSTTP